MVKIGMKVEDDSNKLKYLSIISKHNGIGVQEIKRNIEDNKVVLECDYFETEEIKEFKKTMDALINKGATVHLYQDDRKVQLDYLGNLMSSHEQIAQDREELDDMILGDH